MKFDSIYCRLDRKTQASHSEKGGQSTCDPQTIVEGSDDQLEGLSLTRAIVNASRYINVIDLSMVLCVLTL